MNSRRVPKFPPLLGGEGRGEGERSPDTSRFSEHRSIIAICVGLSVLVWLTFSQAIHFGFVNFDDDVYVYKNPHVTNGITVAGTKWAFTHVHSSNWHPLTWLS